MIKLSLTIFMVATLFASCDSSNSNTSNRKPLIVATANTTEKYQCPMKCQGDTAYTAAGQCPVCEMDLQKLN